MRKRLFCNLGARLLIAVLVTILDECTIANALTEVRIGPEMSACG